MPISGWGTSTRGLGALIAVVMRYPEMSSVYYLPEDRTLTMVFVLRRELTDAEWEALDMDTREILVAYRELTGAPLTQCALRRVGVESSTVLELVRDVDTVAVEEVGIFIELLHERYGADVVSDPHELLEEEMMVQEENIQANLEALKKGDSGHLVAMRDDGRVMVYKT